MMLVIEEEVEDKAWFTEVTYLCWKELKIGDGNTSEGGGISSLTYSRRSKIFSLVLLFDGLSFADVIT